jgi:hypothetical protein
MLGETRVLANCGYVTRNCTMPEFARAGNSSDFNHALKHSARTMALAVVFQAR